MRKPDNLKSDTEHFEFNGSTWRRCNICGEKQIVVNGPDYKPLVHDSACMLYSTQCDICGHPIYHNNRWKHALAHGCPEQTPPVPLDQNLEEIKIGDMVYFPIKSSGFYKIPMVKIGEVVAIKTVLPYNSGEYFVPISVKDADGQTYNIKIPESCILRK